MGIGIVESELNGIALRVLILLSAIVVISLIAYPTLVTSQSENCATQYDFARFAKSRVSWSEAH